MTKRNATHHQQIKEYKPASPRTNNINKHSQPPTLSLNLSVNTCKFCPLTPERFHVLLNSLFKVLFNFPSRYLFAIGLVVIFSLRWSLPPDLGCTPNNPTLRTKRTKQQNHRYGPSTLLGLWPRSRGTWMIIMSQAMSRPKRYISVTSVGIARIQRWALPFSLAVTKGILVSFFSSAY